MSNLKALKDEKTEHLMWFAEHGFHQMKERRKAAKEELASRGFNIRNLKPHECLCNECNNKKKV